MVPFSKTRSSSLASISDAANFAIFAFTFAARHVQRGAAHGLRPAAERADPLLHDARVAVLNRDVIQRDAELIGEHLRERRLVALAVR